MPTSQLPLGSRVFTASTDSPASSSSINALQDELLTMVQGLYTPLSMIPTTSSGWSLTASDPPYWGEPNATTKTIRFALPQLRAGQRFDEIRLSLWRETSTANGSIRIYSFPLGVSASAPASATLEWTDPTGWNDGGGSSIYIRRDVTGLEITAAADRRYELQLISPSDGAGYEVRIYGAGIVAQFGSTY